MTIEVRRVPPDWEHPRDEYGKYIPLQNRKYFQEACDDWDEAWQDWQQGFRPWEGEEDELTKEMYEMGVIERKAEGSSFEECYGERPVEEHYMPDFPAEMCTHYQLYETISEGIPGSPVFDNTEDLWRWVEKYELLEIWNRPVSYVCKKELDARDYSDRAEEFVSQGNYDLALEIYEIAFGYFESLNLVYEMATTFRNIGVLYISRYVNEDSTSQNGLYQALEMFEKALAIDKSNNHKNEFLACDYRYIADVYGFLDQNVRALEMYQHSIDIYESLGFQQETADILNNMGFIYATDGQFAPALKVLTKALIRHRDLDDQDGTAHAFAALGEAYHNHGDHKEAEDSFLLALKILKSIGADPKKIDFVKRWLLDDIY